MEALDVILYRAPLAQSLQLLLCLLLFCGGGECHGNFLSKLLPVRPRCPVTCVHTGLLHPEPAAGTLLQPSTSDVNPLVRSAWRQLQLVCSLFKPVLDNRESFPSELAWGLQFHLPTSSSHCPSAAPPMRGDNGGGTWMKPIEDAAPSCTTR